MTRVGVASWEGETLRQSVQRSKVMKKLLSQFVREEDGAAMIEYSILVGIITAAAILLIIAVGTYVTGAWTDLTDALGVTPT